MPEVFVLGAGFSKAVHDSMPLLEELSLQIRHRVTDLPPPLLDLGDNIELWLTYLSQPQPWLKEYYNLQNRAQFLRITELIGEILNERMVHAVSQDGPGWIHQLVNSWHEKRATVITLNYDTIIERAAVKAGIDVCTIYPVTLADVRRASSWGVEEIESFRLFKLHGSVNWYYSGAASFHGEVLYYGVVAPWGQSNDEGERQCTLAASDKVPLIVPPTTEKIGYFQHETLRQVWLKASQALSAATCVYCVGYSLPFTDLGIRFFLQHSRPNEKVPLFIVNKTKNVNETKDVVERYQQLLSSSYEIKGDYAATGAEGLLDALK